MRFIRVGEFMKNDMMKLDFLRLDPEYSDYI